jgi:hypothetical protein
VQPEKPSTYGRAISLTVLVLTITTWIIGGGLYWWHVRDLMEDASASYVPIELTDGTPVPTSNTHLALRGIPALEFQVNHWTENGIGDGVDYHLIPVVGIGWKPTHPVSFVLKLDRNQELPRQLRTSEWVPRNSYEVQLFARRIGSIPVPAVQKFQTMGVPMAEDATMISPVATKRGEPAMPDSGSEGFFDSILGGVCLLCGFLTFMYVFGGLGVWVGQQRYLKNNGLL